MCEVISALKGTLDSEFLTQVFLYRFTYSVIGSVISLADRSISCAACLPRAISCSRE